MAPLMLCRLGLCSPSPKLERFRQTGTTMNVIDPRTAIVLISAMSALMALVLWALKRSYPPSIQGLGQWAQALLIIVVGGILAASRGQLPEILTTAVPNFLLCWGVYGLYAGTQRFYGVRPATRRWLAGTVAVTLGTLWFALGDPSYTARLRLVTALLAVMFAVHAWFIVRQGMGSFSRWLTVGVIVYIAVIQLVRLATTFFLPMGGTILSGQPLAMLMLDLDHFKTINDTHGHQAGDRVLVEFAAKVQRCLRSKDLLGRFRGEEFALLLPNTPLDAALQVAERIRAACVPQGNEVGCTVSIGVTLSLPQNDSMDKLLARADAALYEAKNTGRNRGVAGGEGSQTKGRGGALSARNGPWRRSSR